MFNLFLKHCEFFHFFLKILKFQFFPFFENFEFSKLKKHFSFFENFEILKSHFFENFEKEGAGLFWGDGAGMDVLGRSPRRMDMQMCA